MSESTRLGFCTDNITGILTLDSTIQSLNPSNTDATNINNLFTIDTGGNVLIEGNLTVIGSSDLSGININGFNVDISGNTIATTLTVSGNTRLNTLDVTGLVNFGSVTFGTTTINDKLAVANNTTIEGELYVVNATTLAGSLGVIGSASVDSLAVSGDANLYTLSMTGELNNTGITNLNTLGVSGSAALNTINAGASTLGNLVALNTRLNSLSVTNATQLAGVDVSGQTTLYGNLYIGGTITGPNINYVTGGESSTLTNLDLSGLLTVGGLTTLNGATSMNNTVSMFQGLNIGSLVFEPTGEIKLYTLTDIVNPIFNVSTSGSLTASNIVTSNINSTLGPLVLASPTNLNNTLNVAGATRLLGALDISGATIIRNRLDVSGSTNLNGVNVVGSTILQSLSAGITTLNRLHVDDISILAGNVTVGGSLDVSGSTSLRSLDVSGSSNLNGLNVVGSTRLGTVVGGSLDISGSTVLNRLDVSGATYLYGGVNIFGSTTFQDVSASSLNITGTSLLGNVVMDSLDVSGSTTLRRLDVSGLTNLNSVNVTGSTILQSLSAGLTTLNSVNVTGTSILGNIVGGSIDISGSTILNRLDVSGVTNLNSVNVIGPTILKDLSAGLTTLNSVNVTGTSILGNIVGRSLDISGSTVLNRLDVSGTTNLNGVTIIGSTSLQGLSAGLTTLNSLTVNGQSTLGNTAVSILNVSQSTVLDRLDVINVTNLRGGLDVIGNITQNGIPLGSGGGASFSDSSGTISGILIVGGVSNLNGGINVNSNNFSVLSNGKTHVQGAFDVSGFTILNGSSVTGNLSVAGRTDLNALTVNSSKFTLDISGNTRLGNLDVSGSLTVSNVLEVALSPVQRVDINGDLFANAGVDIGTISATTKGIQYRESPNQLTISNATANNITCLDSTNTGVPLVVKNTENQNTSAGRKLVTVGYMPAISSINSLSQSVVIEGGLYVQGGITYTGSLSGVAGTGTSGTITWIDISAAVNFELANVGILDISAGVSGLTGIPVGSRQSTTYNSFTGNYLNTSATLTDVINSLNMVISQQNRIIAALRNNQR